MYTYQEEADTRMLLHAYHAIDECQKITINSPDTDVAVLCVYDQSLNCTFIRDVDVQVTNVDS